MARVALVDDDPASLRVAAAAIAAAGAELAGMLSAKTAGGATFHGVDVAVVDVPDPLALPVIETLAAAGITVIATSGAGSVGLAVEAMRRGAVDFVLKPY